MKSIIHFVCFIWIIFNSLRRENKHVYIKKRRCLLCLWKKVPRLSYWQKHNREQWIIVMPSPFRRRANTFNTQLLQWLRIHILNSFINAMQCEADVHMLCDIAISSVFCDSVYNCEHCGSVLYYVVLVRKRVVLCCVRQRVVWCCGSTCCVMLC